jgi:formate hydrogenlyase subunit 3/multisubunit Na+/H+ antiporter MnhD subunit
MEYVAIEGAPMAATDGEPSLRPPVGSGVRTAAVRFGTTGALAFALYLALGDPTDPFDLVTGLVSAGVVALVEIRRDNLKRGLACSPISRLPYVALGPAIATPVAVFGALLHAVAHAFVKITLFLGAGAVYAETGGKYAPDMDGRRRPATPDVASTVLATGVPSVVPRER